MDTTPWTIDAWAAGYGRQRVKGYAPWEPKGRAAQWLSRIQAVIDEYVDYLPMTLRQIGYRLHDAYGFGKDFDALGEWLNRARRAGLVPFDVIRDDGIATHQAFGYDDLDHFWRTVRDDACDYARDLAPALAHPTEIVVEAAGLVPQTARVADRYGVRVSSGGGQGSVTLNHALAARIARNWRDIGLPTHVLHVSDYDPYGMTISTTLAQDLAGFLGPGREHRLVFDRIVITEGQIARYGLPTSPVKLTRADGSPDASGRRWAGRPTAQVEALSPTQYADELAAVLDAHCDLDAHAEICADEHAERTELVAEVEAYLA